MSDQDNNVGIVLHCDCSGEILRIVRDDLGITTGRPSASTIVELVDQDSRKKALKFLEAALETEGTFGWELNVCCDGQLTGLSLFGAVTDNGIIICGVPSRDGLHLLFDEMMKIQNEQLNSLRNTVKEERLEASGHSQREQEMLEEFSRLNNELVNTQRELARRNSDLSVANKLLESLATTDGLTGLKNHRAFQESLENEWKRATRYGTPLSLLMMDVDHFKEFNDEFGHPAGDQVLKQVARILTSECRSDSFVARYGGEEFAVILPNCGDDDANRIAERVRRGVETASWEQRSITASLGVATKQASTPNHAALIAQADAAMYRAKDDGRNRVWCDSDRTATALAT